MDKLDSKFQTFHKAQANSVYLYLRKLNLISNLILQHVTRLDLEDLLGTECSISKRLLLDSSLTRRSIISSSSSPLSEISLTSRWNF